MRLLTIIIPRLKITHRNTYFRVIVFSHHCLFASLYHLFPHHCIFASLHHLFCGFKNAQKQPCAFAFTREVLFKILQKLQKKKTCKKDCSIPGFLWIFRNYLGQLFYKTPPGRLLNVLCTFNLLPVSTGRIL